MPFRPEDLTKSNERDPKLDGADLSARLWLADLETSTAPELSGLIKLKDEDLAHITNDIEKGKWSKQSKHALTTMFDDLMKETASAGANGLNPTGFVQLALRQITSKINLKMVNSLNEVSITATQNPDTKDISFKIYIDGPGLPKHNQAALERRADSNSVFTFGKLLGGNFPVEKK